MKIAVPEFKFRFMADRGNLIYPGNFHPLGVVRATERMFERALAEAPPPERTPEPGLWLVVGGSGGFGSGARVALATELGADVISVSYQPPPRPGHGDAQKALGSAAHYRDRTIERLCREHGRKSVSLNADAFDPETRAKVVTIVRDQFEGRKLTGLIWALAAPKGLDPRSGMAIASALKAYGEAPRMKTFTQSIGGAGSRIEEIDLPMGTPEEVVRTQYVMGGGIVSAWVEALLTAGCCGEGFHALPISYRGTIHNASIYRDGLLGLAKADLEFHAQALDGWLARTVGGRAIAVEGPAVVTEASAAIPGAALYVALLLEVLGQRYEDPLDSMRRLLRDHFAPSKRPKLDMHGLLRMDDIEQSVDVLDALSVRYEALHDGAPFDPEIYAAFMRAYSEPRGFNVPGVDYEAEFDVDEVVSI